MRMNNQKKSNSKPSISQLIEKFQQSPEEAYSQLISSGIYFNHKLSSEFWESYYDLDSKKELHKLFPESLQIFNKITWLKLFYDLNKIYTQEKRQCFEQITSLNPSPKDLIKSFFLCLELGETSPTSSFPNYTTESLESIKILLKEIFPKLNTQNSTKYSASLVQLSNHIIRLQTDLTLIEDFLDLYIWGDFELTEKEDKQGFLLSIDNNSSRIDNLFILNHLKTIFKKDFNRKESHSQISKEDHFMTHDPKMKTDQGLATVYVSKGVSIQDQTPGTTYIELEDKYFENIRSEDPQKREEAYYKKMQLIMEQYFHYHFRQALSNIYHPNYEINIHTLHIHVSKDRFISLYDLICGMSCLIAKAVVLQYLDEISLCNIRDNKNDLFYYFKKNSPGIPEKEIYLQVESAIINWLPDLEEKGKFKAFNFIEYKTLVGWLREIEELKNKSDQDLDVIIQLLSGLETPLPYNPIYKVNELYYFSFKTCNVSDLNQLLYDYYITDKLFNNHKKPQREKLIIGQTQKKREEDFTNSLEDLFRTITPFVKARVEYKDFGNLRGELDTLVYLEEENILFPIQLKLSNVSPRTHKRKKEWIINRVQEDGITQVKKDISLLKNKDGLKFISKELNFHKKIKNPKIYPIIITDNFFADHLSFKYDDRGNKVFCISYFELKHLILNMTIHAKQKETKILKGNNRGNELISAIEENHFWNFLNEYTDQFQYSKQLSVINDEFKIEMKI